MNWFKIKGIFQLSNSGNAPIHMLYEYVSAEITHWVTTAYPSPQESLQTSALLCPQRECPWPGHIHLHGNRPDLPGQSPEILRNLPFFNQKTRQTCHTALGNP